MPDDRIRPEDIPGDLKGNMSLIRQCVEQAEDAPPAPPEEDERRSPPPAGEMPWEPDPAAAYQAMGGRWPGGADEDGVDPNDPTTYVRAGHGGGGRPVPRPPNWPALSPVVPLGTSAGTFYYLDPLGQVRAQGQSEHGQAHLVGLFAPYLAVLHNWWPRWKVGKAAPGEDPDFEWIGCKYEEARDDLISACARKGVWTPFDRVRGVGAWRGEDGELIVHCGDKVWIGPVADEPDAVGRWSKPGQFGKHVYAAGEPQPRPALEDVDPAQLTQAAHELSNTLRSWRWQRKNDWVLLLGWIGAAMVGGALGWRPAVWLTGDAGTGKSTLQELVAGVLGPTLVQTADATGAGIWQVVGMSSRPVAIDELEPSDNPARTKQVIDLARQAASGSVVLRGGQDHQGHQFRSMSPFLFSSILLPNMTQADRSRLAILELEPLEKGSATPDLTPRRLGAIGAALRARLALRWHEVRTTIERFRRGLAAVGHANRGADQFGTLLAMAYILRTDEPLTDDRVAEICAPFAADVLSETSEKLADWQEMLLRLTSVRVDAYRGGNKCTVGRLVGEAAADDLNLEEDRSSAERILQEHGLKIVRRADVKYDLPDTHMLAMANAQHAGLAQLFEGTKYAGGVWVQSAGRVPDAVKPKSALRFAGIQYRATLLPLSLVLDPSGASPTQDDDGTEDARRAAAVRSSGDGTAPADGTAYGPPDDAAYPHASGWGAGPDPFGMEDDPS